MTMPVETTLPAVFKLRPPRWVALALWLSAWGLMPWALQHDLALLLAIGLVSIWIACRWTAPLLEQHADRLVVVEGRRHRTYRFEEVVSIGVVASQLRQTWTLKARFESGDVVTFWGLPKERAAVLMERLAAVLEARTMQSLACGETVCFDDPRKVPRWFAWVVPMTFAITASFALASDQALVNVARLLGVCAGLYGGGFLVAMVLWSVGVWMRTRHTRGFMLGPEGFRLGRMGAAPSMGGAVFRGARGEAGGWMPWSALRLIAWDGHGLTLTVEGIQGSVQLTEETHNLPVLARVLLRKMRGQ